RGARQDLAGAGEARRPVAYADRERARVHVSIGVRGRVRRKRAAPSRRAGGWSPSRADGRTADGRPRSSACVARDPRAGRRPLTGSDADRERQPPSPPLWITKVLSWTCVVVQFFAIVVWAHVVAKCVDRMQDAPPVAAAARPAPRPHPPRPP